MFVIGVPPNDFPQGWEIKPDPQIAGQNVAVNDNVLIALVEEGWHKISVLSPYDLTDTEIDGEEQGMFENLDAAIEAANKILEIPS